MLRAAAVSAGILILGAAPAHAQELPGEGAKLFLKNHEEVPLAFTDDGAVLSADHDLWGFIAVEALNDLGEYHLQHDDTGQCLTADTAVATETIPVALADCADALAWEIVWNDVPSHNDFRFITTDGYYLGLEDGADAVEGAEVQAVLPETGASRHFQEWHIAFAPTQPPSESPSTSESPSPDASTSPAAAQPKLPTTGAGLGAMIGAGAVALVGGAAALLWWQRRRALRSDW
jgi:LPXTG-motif cell wall-anchored protein